MRKVALCLAVLMVVGGVVAIAGEQDHSKMKGKTHEVNAEVVSVDAEAMTITIKMGDEQKTAPVSKEAAAQLGKVKAGDMVILTCQDDENGEHEMVTKIKPAEKHH
jgi:hypothetical protein